MATKPNIVLIMIDDMGWMDLGVQGNEAVHTPHLDRFATQGMRFDRLTSLSLRAYKQDQTPSGSNLAKILLGAQHSAQGFADVHDVNLVLTTEDVGGHLRIPEAGAVAKVHTGFNHFFDNRVCHETSSWG